MVLGTEATERNSTAADEDEASLAQARLGDAYEFAGMSRRSHSDTLTRKTEALWLMTSKSIARALDFDTKVVSPKKLRPLAETLEAKTRDMRQLAKRALQYDDWTRMKLPMSLGGMGIRAVTSQLEISCDTTMKKTKNQAKRIEWKLTGKREHLSEWREYGSTEMWDGAHDVKHEDRAEAMTGLDLSSGTL